MLSSGKEAEAGEVELEVAREAAVEAVEAEDKTRRGKREVHVSQVAPLERR